METKDALAFVREHGIVLLSARGPVPNLAEAIAGSPILGSWWGHPKAYHIFRVFGSVCDSPDVLQCRLINGKVTLVHRRLWPALVRVASRLPKQGLAAVRQEHTPRGSHRVIETPYPKWVPRDVIKIARQLAVKEACAQLEPLFREPLIRSSPTR
jgi:hypothetical protein